MNQLNVSTKGKPIKTRFSMLHFHPTLKTQMAHLSLEIGDIEVSIQFNTHNEMISFCKTHNFFYTDNRNTPELDGQNNEGDLVDNS